jgi:hypothetical protein
MYNKTIIHGRLCKEWSEVKTSTKVMVANSLACQIFKNTVFYDIIGNKEQLKNVLHFIPKGAEVIIEGVVEKPKKSLDYNLRLFIDKLYIVRGIKPDETDDEPQTASKMPIVNDDDYCPF